MMNISQKVTIQFSLVAATCFKDYTQKQGNFHVFKMKRNYLNAFKIRQNILENHMYTF